MNSVRRIRRGIRQRVPFLVAAGLVALLAAVPLTSAFAEDGTPPPPGERLDQQLETCLERLGEWRGVQETNLERAAEAIDRIEEVLGKAEGLGIDVSEGKALLADMVSLLATANQHHDQAAAILDAHSGYDGDGSVVDREQAGDTCRTGRDALASGRDALLELRDLGRELRQLASEWREGLLQAPASDGV